MRAIINIGMRRAHDGVLSTSDIQALMDDFAVEEYAHRVVEQHGSCEPTYIAHVDGWTDDKAMVIAQALDQGCIAQYDLDRCEGKLVGPFAVQWGSFEPTMFQVL